MNTGKYASVFTNPDIVADDCLAFRKQRTVKRRNIQHLIVGCAVGIVGDKHVGTRKQVVAYDDAVDTGNVVALAEMTVAANGDGGSVALSAGRDGNGAVS